jgi:hypothetical protein
MDLLTRVCIESVDWELERRARQVFRTMDQAGLVDSLTGAIIGHLVHLNTTRNVDIQ